MPSEAMRAIPLVDHHCHAYLNFGGPIPLERFRKAFTEADDPVIVRDHMPNALVYRWLIKQMARFLDCAPTEEAVLAARNALNPGEWSRRLLRDVNMGALLIDTGFPGPLGCSPGEFAALTGCQVETVLRLETVAQELIVNTPSFDDLVEQFRAAVAGLRAAGYVGAKSIVAYRTGLEILPVDVRDARAAYLPVKAQADQQGKVRLASKPLLDYLLWEALTILDRESVPLQLHVGYGDPDTDLRLGNPLHLRGVLEGGGFRQVPLVLLHNYPYIREAGYLASVYPNVYLDVSLAIPMAVTGSERFVAEALELTPTSKFFFATDAHTMPEVYWAAAHAHRQALENVLERLVTEGYLTAGEALESAQQILCDNALRVYGVTLKEETNP